MKCVSWKSVGKEEECGNGDGVTEGDHRQYSRGYYRLRGMGDEDLGLADGAAVHSKWD